MGIDLKYQSSLRLTYLTLATKPLKREVEAETNVCFLLLLARIKTPFLSVLCCKQESLRLYAVGFLDILNMLSHNCMENCFNDNFVAN